MKYKKDVPHILTEMKPKTKKEPHLVFIKFVRPSSHGINNAASQPDDWENVRHLTGDLYYVYQNHNPDNGFVYYGKWVTE